MSNSTLNTTGNLSPDDCSLTPRTRALNVLLTAITGPLIAGVSEGGFAALIQAGLTFGAMPRLFFYLGPFMYLALRMRPLKSRQFRPALRVLHRLLTCDTSPDNDPPNDLDDDDDDDNDDNNGNNDYIPLSRPVPQQTEQQRQTQYQHDVTLLGCVSWAYSALYAPTVATMWLIKNWKRSDISPWLKILKSFGFAATAGSSTVDTKNRYAMWLARRLGNWAGALFNLVSATGICLLATVFMILFTHSVADIFKSERANMTAVYDVQTYLLDKSNIQDTVTRMMYAFDNKDSSLLIDQVYTPEIHLDYDNLLLGGKPEVITSKAWADRLEHMHDAYDTTQHTVHNFLIELPQPSSANKEVARPDSCVVYAHADGWFYKCNAEGRPRIMCRRNGFLYADQTSTGCGDVDCEYIENEDAGLTEGETETP
ncbi:hypothetical protein KCU77_g9047, partial [Aureobasidium melanogenum]